MKWKAMTFNLRVNVDSDGPNAWPLRVAAVARTILRHKADIVCVQEGLYSMLRDLDPSLGHYGWIGEGRRGGFEDEFCAILYDKNKWRVEGGETGKPIDYIFASPDVAIERIEVDRGKYEGLYPSDHYPVCAVLSK
ncbi:endonuclease/exonuclease/phosphatase family protein [Cohnella yongneupensis]|uniref:Endonuclease/exonuclease/phosphatase family protein n=1 Tax=Cohnella yongneupensis TaxID=425006 RepID=A0ABW0R3J5_9BACL